MKNVGELIGDVNAARRRVSSAVEGMSAEQERLRAEPGEWSVPQIIEHLVLAEQGGIYGMWAAAHTIRNGDDNRTGERPHQGRMIEEIIALTWKEHEEAPPAAVPQIDGPLAFCIAELEACQYLLVSLGAMLHDLDPEEIIYPHFLMGPLDVNQRLQFLRWHLDHHREQILGIIEKR